MRLPFGFLKNKSYSRKSSLLYDTHFACDEYKFVRGYMKERANKTDGDDLGKTT